MTDNEIIKALECCVHDDYDYCKECSYLKNKPCQLNLIQDAFDLINRQRAEIERLKAPRFMITSPQIAEENLTPLAKLQKVVIYDEPLMSFKRIDEEGIKAEAVKEFAERLKTEMIKSRYDSTVSPYSRACNAVIDFWVNELDQIAKRNGR
jgi:hypothetical protein